MVTLTVVDFIILFLMNLSVTAFVTYFVNYIKRSAELAAEEGSHDKEYLKKIIRDAVNETRNVLTELRVHEFKIITDRRRLPGMNSLVEKLSMVDSKLGDHVWELVNAPVILSVIADTDKRQEVGTAGSTYYATLIKDYYATLELALKRCAELERNPISA